MTLVHARICLVVVAQLLIIWQDRYLPFTFSHPAAILPFPRKHLVFSALVVGSMSPDFYYFALVPDSQRFGHTLLGLFLFCLPAGLAILWLFHKVFKAPLLSLAPAHLRHRLAAEDLNFRFGPASRMAWILLSIAIGWVTHMAWDGVTHWNGIFVTPDSFLRYRPPFWPHLALYGYLQLFSSVMGLLFLALAYWRWSHRTPVSAMPVVRGMSIRTRTAILVAAAVAALVFGVLVGIRGANELPHEWFRVFVIRTIVACITAGFVEVVAFSVYWHLAKDKPRKPSSGAGLREPAYQD